jgi:hypothetical protein
MSHHHQIDPKNTMAGNDDEKEKALPEAHSAVPAPATCAASGDTTKVVTAVAAADVDTDEENACSDDEDAYSDYSNEGRLERAYESDEDLHDQVDASDLAAFDINITKKLIDADAEIDLERMNMLKTRSIAAARSEAYRRGVCGDASLGSLYGNSDYGYGGGGGYGISSSYQDLANGGGIWDHKHDALLGLISHYYAHYCGLSDADYGLLSDADCGIRSDVDYGSLSDFYDTGLSLSDFHYGTGGGHYRRLPA